MRKFYVWIEIAGNQALIGDIAYDENGTASFAYAGEYLQKADAVPVSLSLPLQKERFSPLRTRNFFEGLLPEGFTRKSIAR